MAKVSIVTFERAQRIELPAGAVLDEAELWRSALGAPVYRSPVI